MAAERIEWQADGQAVQLGLYRAGTGRVVLMLPALSSISTRHEMRPLQQLLSADFQTVSTDWPGFGNLARPRVDWRPAIYREFVVHLLGKVVPQPYAVIAAGHAAGYVLGVARGVGDGG